MCISINYYQNLTFVGHVFEIVEYNVDFIEC